MSLLVLGLNHRTAPVELRERLTIDRDRLAPNLELLSQHVQQGVVLSTCNRLEVYTFDDQDADLICRVAGFLSAYSGVGASVLDAHLYQQWGDECARHLFRVASGLDSMVVGERQVLGQVRAAFSAASQGGYARGPLSHLFHQAFRTARHIHRDTNIGSYSRSVSQAGVQLARGLLGNLSEKQALVIGAGDAGRLVAQALADAGVRQMVVTNRTQWRAEDLARELEGVAAPFDDLPRQLAEADVVISSTGSPGYVLDTPTVRQARQQRPQRPLLLIDIAVPRDIDPGVADLDNVQLYDIDALQMMSESDSSSLQKDIAWAEHIVDQETRRFREWWESLNVVPLIASIREQAEEIRRGEVARTLANLQGQPLADLDQLSDYLDAMTSALVKKLLHRPTVFLRETRDPAEQELARQLFNFDGGPRRRGRK